MTVRPLKDSDIPALKAMGDSLGFPYPDLSGDKLVEAVLVVVDDSDCPVMAVAAKRIVEMYFWCGRELTPHESVGAIRMLHEAMAEGLRIKGYNVCEAFLPPSVAQKFGRRLERTFGWGRNWSSWFKRF